MTAKEKLDQIAEVDGLMEEFIMEVEDRIMDDDEPYDKKFRRLKEAYDEHPDIVDDIMMTLCGWRMETMADTVLSAYDY